MASAFPGGAVVSHQQRQGEGGAGGGCGGADDLAALQLQPPAGLEQELQHQAQGDQLCTGLSQPAVTLRKCMAPEHFCLTAVALPSAAIAWQAMRC